MDKALEIERLKQEREALREVFFGYSRTNIIIFTQELQKIRQKDASNQEKIKTMEGKIWEKDITNTKAKF